MRRTSSCDLAVLGRRSSAVLGRDWKRLPAVVGVALEGCGAIPKTGTMGSGGSVRPERAERGVSAVKGRRSCSLVLTLRRLRFPRFSSSTAAVMGRNRLAEAGAIVLKKWACARESSSSLLEWALVDEGNVSGDDIESALVRWRGGVRSSFVVDSESLREWYPIRDFPRGRVVGRPSGSRGMAVFL